MNKQEINQDITDNFPKPSYFTKNLEALQSQLPAILADFNKFYVFYNKNPEYQEYQNMFENIKSNLNNLNSEIFTLSNDVQTNTDDINRRLLLLNGLIKIEKERNKELKKKLGIEENKNSAASELIMDYKNMYESGYLRNWALLLSIFLVGYTITKIYKKPITPTFA